MLLGWMMRIREINSSPGGFLLLLLLLVALAFMKENFNFAGRDSPCCGEMVLVQVSGDVKRPGVYEFKKAPDMKRLLFRAGGLTSGSEPDRSSTSILFHSGADIRVRCRGNAARIFQGEMSPFYKVTLGIPVSLNRETQEGLTAIPGIGSGLAGAIIRERKKRGAFQSIVDILSIQGIGPSLYEKISRYLVL
jgi:competence protein ComEA